VVWTSVGKKHDTLLGEKRTFEEEKIYVFDRTITSAFWMVT
jgi:hypothetical protein